MPVAVSQEPPELRSTVLPALISDDTARQADLRELIEGSASGDRVAYARLFDLVSPRVYGLVLRILRDAHLSQEVTQDVMLQVWERASRFDADRGHPISWIMQMAHGRAVDNVRHCEASAARDHRYARLVAVDNVGDVVMEAVIDADDQVNVRAALRDLTALQREAITMAFYDGHTYAAIATITGVPVGTIKSRIRDGLIRLGSLMAVAA